MSCEPHEENISALLDGELDAREAGELLDHLLGCASCRRFYHDARALDEIAAPQIAAAPLARSGKALPPHPGAHRHAFLPRFTARWAAAAVLLLALGFAGGHLWKDQPGSAASFPADEVLAVTLGEAGEADSPMTPERFLDLTLELLRADPRFRHQMQTVLDEVREPIPGGAEGVLLAAVHPAEGRSDRRSEESPLGERRGMPDPQAVTD
ncbi:MAG: zf-HC2 domain-containing protein [Candidatus Eisenbacteria bacterium]